jgi:hypothetical protein
MCTRFDFCTDRVDIPAMKLFRPHYIRAGPPLSMIELDARHVKLVSGSPSIQELPQGGMLHDCSSNQPPAPSLTRLLLATTFHHTSPSHQPLSDVRSLSRRHKQRPTSDSRFRVCSARETKAYRFSSLSSASASISDYSHTYSRAAISRQQAAQEHTPWPPQAAF